MAEVFNQREENSIVDRALTPLPQPHLTGMKLQGDIALGEFLFNTIDEYGVVWVITDIDGWWQHPEPDMPDIPRGLGDGSYDIKGRYQARIITLEGSFLTPDPALVEAARDRLIAATNLVYRGAWLKTGIESDNKRSSFVRLSGGPSIETVTARGRTNFSIGLKAADPIKYAWNDSDPDGYERVEIPATNRTTGATGVETITNIGNVDVPVNFEISGPVTGPARVYNRTTDKLLYIVSNLRGRLTSSIVNKQLDFNEDTLEDIVTLTTTAAHGYLQGDTVEISGLAEPDLNGDFLITEVPTSTTFRYSLFPLNTAVTKAVVAKKLVSNVATVFTKEAHGFVSGNTVFLKDIDSVFNGNYVIDTAPTATTFTFGKNRSSARTVTGAILISNIATITTSQDHGFVEGEDVTISGLDQNYNGTFTITSIPSTTTFSYSKTRTDVRAIASRSMANDVATITMSSTHGFSQNEVVAVSGMERTQNQIAGDIDSPFNGTFIIKSTPTTSSFTYDVPRAYSSTITTTSRSANVASITVAESIQADIGDTIVIEDLANSSYNGTYTITQVLSSTTYVFASSGSNEAPISVSTGKVSLLSLRPFIIISGAGIFDLLFDKSHNFIVGESVTITGLNPTFNGTYTILDIPVSNVIRLDGTGKPTLGPSATSPSISLNARTGNTATITTSSAHNFVNNQYVRVVGVEAALIGTFIVTVTSPTTFTYTTVGSGTIASAAPTGGPGAIAIGVNVTRSRSVVSTADAGEARVSGGLPFASYTAGSATINGNIVNSDGSEVEASGIAVKKANIPFTPGLIGALADFGPDVLEVDTLTRDVALNGNYEGARAKLDVLTEFFFLQPGANEIEFADDKNSVSTGLLKVFYRSGWLG
jgi:DNA/RNA endonuclease YhcR with UshA esterase domain